MYAPSGDFAPTPENMLRRRGEESGDDYRKWRSKWKKTARECFWLFAGLDTIDVESKFVEPELERRVEFACMAALSAQRLDPELRFASGMLPFELMERASFMGTILNGDYDHARGTGRVGDRQIIPLGRRTIIINGVSGTGLPYSS